MNKFKVGDQVLVTAGKDKGQTGFVTKVFAEERRLVVEGANMYTRHIKRVADQAGQKIRRERPLPMAKVAILNHHQKPDRVGFKLDKQGTKTRIFKKTGRAVPEPKPQKKK